LYNGLIYGGEVKKALAGFLALAKSLKESANPAIFLKVGGPECTVGRTF
jgi:hypothetical protein